MLVITIMVYMYGLYIYTQWCMYSCNKMYFTIAWEVHLPTCPEAHEMQWTFFLDLQPCIQVPKCVVVGFLLSKKGTWRVSFPNSSWTTAFCTVSIKFPRKCMRKTRMRFWFTNSAKSHFRTTELDSCQEKESMDKPTLLKDLARLHPNKNPTRIPEDSPPKWSQLIPLLMGHCFFLPILSAGPLPALDSQVLVRHLRPQLIYVVAPPSKHPWREPYEYMQSVCTVYICIYIIISYLILIASICFIFLKIFKDII